MKHILRALFHYTIEQINLVAALERSWQKVDPELRNLISNGNSGSGRLIVIAFGKAAVPMTGWLLEKTVHDRICGILSAPSIPSRYPDDFAVFAGGHPVPNQASLDAGRTAMEIARQATKDDLVVYLVSGGGSSLFELPLYDELSLVDLNSLYGTLVRCGADIVEINTVRKHLSAVKGGKLAAAAHPARQLTFYISDVPAGQESSVASGPTLPDTSTLSDFRKIAATYKLANLLPESVKPFFQGRVPLPETPKPNDPVFSKSAWFSILDNKDAIQAACQFVENEGWCAVPDVTVDNTGISIAAEQLIARLLSFSPVSPDGRPVCIVSGGELSSPVWGTGVGGRNQAFVLECVPRIARKRIAVMSAGTDGIDGNSPSAGAVADGRTLRRARTFGLDPVDFLRNSDSHTFFDTLGDTITCGPTGNNVRDIRVLVTW